MERDLSPDMWAQITGYLNGQLTDADRAAFEQRLGIEADLRAMVARWQVVWDMTAVKQDAVETNEARERFWGMVQHSAGAPRAIPAGLSMTRRKPFVGRQTLRTGSALIGCIGIALGVLLAIDPAAHRNTVNEAPSTHRYATRLGQQASVALADGSRAQLGPATTLFVRDHPPQRTIDIQVIGEALFTVEHTSTRAFRVQAGSAVARVLGTTFLVRRYSTDPVARVVVVVGRVALQGVRAGEFHPRDHVLIAGSLGAVNDSGGVDVTPNIALDEHVGWTTGQLVFRKTLVRDAATELGRAYGVEIRVADSALAQQHLSWTISTTNQSLDDVLEPLTAVLSAHSIREGHVITLVPGRRGARRSVEPRLPFPPPVEHSYGK